MHVRPLQSRISSSTLPTCSEALYSAHRLLVRAQSPPPLPQLDPSQVGNKRRVGSVPQPTRFHGLSSVGNVVRLRGDRSRTMSQRYLLWRVPLGARGQCPTLFGP